MDENEIYLKPSEIKSVDFNQDDKHVQLDHDEVNSPEHYSDTSFVECIDAMTHCFGIEEVQIYAKIAAFKYLWRSNSKHATPEQDLKKAEWYMRFCNGNDPRESK